MGFLDKFETSSPSDASSERKEIVSYLGCYLNYISLNCKESDAISVDPKTNKNNAFRTSCKQQIGICEYLECISNVLPVSNDTLVRAVFIIDKIRMINADANMNSNKPVYEVSNYTLHRLLLTTILRRMVIDERIKIGNICSANSFCGINIIDIISMWSEFNTEFSKLDFISKTDYAFFHKFLAQSMFHENCKHAKIKRPQFIATKKIIIPKYIQYCKSKKGSLMSIEESLYESIEERVEEIKTSKGNLKMTLERELKKVLKEESKEEMKKEESKEEMKEESKQEMKEEFF
jgi:hypothetical protein